MVTKLMLKWQFPTIFSIFIYAEFDTWCLNIKMKSFKLDYMGILCQIDFLQTFKLCFLSIPKLNKFLFVFPTKYIQWTYCVSNCHGRLENLFVAGAIKILCQPNRTKLATGTFHISLLGQNHNLTHKGIFCSLLLFPSQNFKLSNYHNLTPLSIIF